MLIRTIQKQKRISDTSSEFFSPLCCKINIILGGGGEVNNRSKKIIEILALISIVALFIATCKTEVNNTEISTPSLSISPLPGPSISQNPSPDSNYPSISPGNNLPEDVVEAKYLKIIYTADNKGKYFALSDWQTYIQKKFGIEIYVDYQLLSSDSILKKNRLIDGLLYLKYNEISVSVNNTEVLRLSNGDFAYNLAPYYEKYGWNKFIEKQYMDALNINGSIYAIPAADMKYIVPRYYNAEYLEKLDMDVPETISQFHEYLLATKELNAGDNTFYPMVVFPMYTLCTADIFRAYGVYFNSIMNNARVFNPNTNSFEDGVFSENIEEAVGFIRQLQQEELFIVYDMFGIEGGVSNFNKKLATEYNVVYNTKKFGFSPYSLAEFAYERTNGYYLTHINLDNVCEIRSDLAFYMFPKSIENINGTIELFNRLFTDSQYYADLRFGIEETDYYVIDGIPVKQEPNVGVLLNLKQIKPIYDRSASNSPESIEIAESISNELAYENNVFNQKWSYSDRGVNRDSNQDNSIEILFDKELSPYDAIEKYRSEFRKSGKLAILNELNEKIGAVSIYDYGN